MNSRVWLYVGVAALAVLIGFLVGASASPVAGLAITAAFGVITGVVGYLSGPKAVAPMSLATVGATLTAFSVAMSVGLGLGMYARLIAVPQWMKETRQFPWAVSRTPPTDAAVALDWIAVDEKLRGLGFDETQIQNVYAIDAADNTGAFRHLLDKLAPSEPRPTPPAPVARPAIPVPIPR